MSICLLHPIGTSYSHTLCMSFILELVGLDKLGAFFVIHFVEIVEEVGLSILLRPLFVESRVYSELELHSKCLAPLYLSFEPKNYHGDSDNHWLLGFFKNQT